MTGNIGTVHWTAPEILNNERYHFAADIYSLGMVMVEMVSGQLEGGREGREEGGREVGRREGVREERKEGGGRGEGGRKRRERKCVWERKGGRRLSEEGQ